jgi:E3 ubiquitin-protein ligase MUL1
MVGQLLTIFGEFVFNKVTKSLNLVNPIFTMKTKEQLVRFLLDKNTRQGRNKGLLMAISTYFAYRVIRRAFIILKKLWSSYQAHFRKYRLDEFHNVTQINTTGFRCVQCKTKPRSVLYRPCLHLNVCWTCETKRGGEACPECHQEIETSVHIYTV